MMAFLRALVLCAVAVSCGGQREGAADATRDADLERAARGVIAFLRGQAAFESIRVADAVTLHVAPEGGGGRTMLTRDRLSDPANWVVRSGGATYSFVPPSGLDAVTIHVGRHFNCMELALASRAPELAALPHVGVKLEHEPDAGCLQTWNVTLVFAGGVSPPQLVAAVYDQWEW